jgi:threonine dehydratase
MRLPVFADLLDARARIAPHLPRTPLHRYPALDELLGFAAYVKHENHQPVGVFKVRGGVNLVASLGPDERRRGVVTASTGNHGQSIAWSARAFGVRAVVCVPAGANPGKVAAIRGFGAEIAEAGAKFEDAVANAEAIAARDGRRYVHSANEPLLIAGVGTYALEMLDDHPELEALVVPVGLGSGAAGTCLVAKTVNPRLRIIAVQAAASPAVHDSWRSGRIETRPNETFAEGLATGRAAQWTLAMLREQVRGGRGARGCVRASATRCAAGRSASSSAAGTLPSRICARRSTPSPEPVGRRRPGTPLIRRRFPRDAGTTVAPWRRCQRRTPRSRRRKPRRA